MVIEAKDRKALVSLVLTLVIVAGVVVASTFANIKDELSRVFAAGVIVAAVAVFGAVAFLLVWGLKRYGDNVQEGRPAIGAALDEVQWEEAEVEMGEGPPGPHDIPVHSPTGTSYISRSWEPFGTVPNRSPEPSGGGGAGTVLAGSGRFPAEIREPWEREAFSHFIAGQGTKAVRTWMQFLSKNGDPRAQGWPGTYEGLKRVEAIAKAYLGQRGK